MHPQVGSQPQVGSAAHPQAGASQPQVGSAQQGSAAQPLSQQLFFLLKSLASMPRSLLPHFGASQQGSATSQPQVGAAAHPQAGASQPQAGSMTSQAGAHPSSQQLLCFANSFFSKPNFGLLQPESQQGSTASQPQVGAAAHPQAAGASQPQVGSTHSVITAVVTAAVTQFVKQAKRAGVDRARSNHSDCQTEQERLHDAS